jgi:hypothetical protein
MASRISATPIVWWLRSGLIQRHLRGIGGLMVEIGNGDLSASRGKNDAISLPIPLAVPVPMAALSFKRMSASFQAASRHAK